MENSFSLIVPAYREEEFIEESLMGLLSTFRDKKFNFEVHDYIYSNSLLKSSIRTFNYLLK